MLRKHLFKLISFILVLTLVFGIVGCKKEEPPVVEEDKIAPIITVTKTEVELLAGDQASAYDLKTGVTALDNKDGNLNASITVDDGGFDPLVPGTYTITYTVKDKAGNTKTATRTITVLEASLAVAIGTANFTDVLYNAPLYAQYEGVSFGFDLTKLHVYSKAYWAWSLENWPERMGSWYGAVAITDATGKVTYTRHNYASYYMENDAIVQEQPQNAGTYATYPELARASENLYHYIPITHGGVLGDLLSRIPDGGYIIFGVNAYDNAAANAPRKFVLDNLYDVADTHGVGSQVTFVNFSTVTSEPMATYPVIKTPFTIENDDTLQAAVKCGLEIDLGTTDFDLMEGVTAKDSQGADATDKVQYQVFNYVAMGLSTLDQPDGEHLPTNTKQRTDGQSILSEPVEGVDTTTPFAEGETERKYIVEYTITDDYGKTDKTWRIVTVKNPLPIVDQLIMRDGTAYEVRYNDVAGLAMTPSGLAMRSYTDTKFFVYTVEGYNAAVTANLEGYSANGGIPKLPYSLVITLDKDGHVVHFRNQDASYDALGNAKTAAELGYSNVNLLAGITDWVPADGYILIFPNTTAAQYKILGFKLFWDPAYTSGLPAAGSKTVEWNHIIARFQPAGTILPEMPAELVDQDLIIVDGVSYKMAYNSIWGLQSDTNDATGNAYMRYSTDTFYVYTKQGYIDALADATVATTWTGNANVPFLPWSNAAILDANGKIVAFRHFKNFNNTLDPVNGAGVLAGVVNDVPDGGYLVVFPGVTAAMGYQAFYETDGNNESPAAEPTVDWENVVVNVKPAGTPMPVLKQYHDVVTITEGETVTEYEVSYNNADALKKVDGNIPMRKETSATKFFTYSKQGYIDAVAANAEANVANGGVPYLPTSVVVVFDATGKVSYFRWWAGAFDATGTALTVDAAWGKTEATTVTGVLAGIGDLIPDGGYVAIFPVQGANRLDNKLRIMGFNLFMDHGYVPQTNTEPAAPAAKTVDWTVLTAVLNPHTELPVKDYLLD